MQEKKSTSKSPWRFIMPAMLILAALLLVYGFIKSPYSPLRMCTLMGCQDKLELVLSKQMDGEFSVEVSEVDGETRQVTCNATPGAQPSDTYPLGAVCNGNSVTFYDFSPEEVRIDITWQGGSHTSEGHPVYTITRPNGPGCEPACKLGKMNILLP